MLPHSGKLRELVARSLPRSWCSPAAENQTGGNRMHYLQRISHQHRLIAAAILALLMGAAVFSQVIAAEAGKPEKLLFVSSRAGAKSFNIFTLNPDGSEPVN